MVTSLYFCASFTMDKIRNIFYKPLIFFCLTGLLFASSHVSAYVNVQKSPVKKEISQKAKTDLVIKAVSVEATVSGIQINLQQSFYFIFTHTKLVLKEFIPAKILSPGFIDQFMVTLFTRIIPTKAP